MRTVKDILKETFNKDPFFINVDIKDISIFYINGLADDNKISKLVIEPIKTLNDFTVFLPNIIKVDLNVAINNLLLGDCILLYLDQLYSVDVKNSLSSSVAEPDGETTEFGPNVGFLENILLNTILIRRVIRNTNLKITLKTLTGENKNNIAILYLDNVVDKGNLALIDEKINNVLDKAIVDSNYLKELIVSKPFELFPTIGITKRPDYCARVLKQGKIVILVDGSPNALILPFLFYENFESQDDYYVNYFYASYNKFIRMCAFIISTFIPGIFIALLSYHQELVPTKLAISIAEARTNVPFPMIIEIIILIFAFDIIRETGSKIPKSLGTAISIVSGLILGSAIVEAKVVSTISIIIVSVSQLAGIITPCLKTPIVIFRFITLILAAYFGIQGVLFGFIFLICYLLDLKSLNANYLKHLFDFSFIKMIKTYFKLPGGKK